MNVKINLIVRQIIVAIIYGLLSAIGINLFLSSANSYSIGIPGIAQLIQALLVAQRVHLNLSTLIIILNIPLVFLSIKLFGSRYTCLSLSAIISNVFFLKIIPHIVIIHDRITNTILGAVIIGIAIGLCFRNGFSTGGTDVVVSYIKNKYKKNIGFINSVINGIILFITAVSLGIPGAIYSLIGMIVTSYFMDKVYIQQKNVTLTVLTKNRQPIIEELKKYRHGATFFKGIGIYKHEETDMILIIVQKNEIKSFKQAILQADLGAYIIVQTTDLLNGNYNRID
ncbi:YitT family protein [Leuconostoc pseudomesenteroides]|uniref:YitT family protein n=1 Tax=Leuconostoc pseudomesenteroides TaxID=33968 RepID=UPI00403504E8